MPFAIVDPPRGFAFMAEIECDFLKPCSRTHCAYIYDDTNVVDETKSIAKKVGKVSSSMPKLKASWVKANAFVIQSDIFQVADVHNAVGV